MIVWLASYPRSGNTFLRVVLNSYFGQSTLSLHNDTHDIAADENIARITGHENLPENFSLEEARKSNELFLIKTHEPPPDKNDKFIYLIRDGRASCWSYAHYRLDYHEAGYLDKSLEEVIRGEVVFGGWGEHLESWSPQDSDNALLVRFEDLVANTDSEVRRLAEFLGVEALDASVPEFGELQALNSKFFRSGSTDAWKDGFPPRLLELFWLKNRNHMLSLGYDDLVPPIEPNREELFRMLHSASVRRIRDMGSIAASQTNPRAKAAEELALKRLEEDHRLVTAVTKRAWDDVHLHNKESIDTLLKQLQDETGARFAVERKVARLEAKVENTAEHLAASQANADSLRQELVEAKNQRSNTLEREKTLKQERDDLRTEIQSLERLRDTLITEKGSLATNLNEKDRQLGSWQQKLDTSYKSLHSSRKNLESTQKNLESTQKNLESAQKELDSSNKELGKSRAELSDKRKELASSKQEKAAIVKRNQSLLNTQGTLKKELAANSEILADLQQDQTEVFELFEELTKSRALLSPRQKYKKYSALLQKLREQLDSLRNE